MQYGNISTIYFYTFAPYMLKKCEGLKVKPGQNTYFKKFNRNKNSYRFCSAFFFSFKFP